MPVPPAWVQPSCVVALPPSGVHGQLTVDGGPLSGNTTPAFTLNYTYTVAYRLVDEPNLTLVGVGCAHVGGNTTVEPNGSFAFVPEIPPMNCTNGTGGMVCAEYLAPDGPVNLSIGGGPPRGYAVSVTGEYATFAIALVYDLASVTIAPGGPTVTTSVGAPTGFTASAWAANGTPTPLASVFGWSVSGAGWSFDGPTTGSSIDLTAVAGASVATVEVRASASDRGAALGPVEATVEVVALSTEIETGEANRTAVDSGGTIAIELTAFGAAGFAYSASVEPGLGLPEMAAPCSAGPPDDGAVQLACSASVTYPMSGTAQPTANITNGYSTASWRFPDVVVSPPPKLEVVPTAPVGYALTPLGISILAANGSGTMPYEGACLEADPIAAICTTSAGPKWTFEPTFTGPGAYPATAWAIDADGTNTSVSFSIEIVPPLALGPVRASAANATVSAPLQLNASVSGGVLPMRYWWNVSTDNGPVLDGDLASDGALNLTIVPSEPGPLAVTLTVVDRLGTVVASELVLSVGPAAAERVAPIAEPPAGPVTAGEPVTLSWGAFDLAGAVDTSFTAAVELDLSGEAGSPEAWVNASGVGPLASLGSGEYGVPGSAWIDGVLSVMVTVGTAATVAVGLSGSSLPGTVAPTELAVEPDRAHLRLYAPTVARPGDRTNATLWRVEDRFGNAAPGATVTIGLSFGGSQDDVVVATISLPGGGSGVWVNYSAPTRGAGVVTVVDEAGDIVLGPISVPAAPSVQATAPAIDALEAAVPAGAAGVAMFAVVRRRRRARIAAPAEEALRSLAEGRARVTELIGDRGAVDLAELEAVWQPPPAPPALADWLASLVADGTVRATVGDDGRARFCLADGRARAPQVTVDPQVLDRSLRRRDEELGMDAAEADPQD